MNPAVQRAALRASTEAQARVKRENAETDDDNMGDMWREIRLQRQEKRASNRESSAQMLLEHGIHFTSNNGGAHLIVQGPTCFIDFWPGTGKWIFRGSGKYQIGVRNLIGAIKRAQGNTP